MSFTRKTLLARSENYGGSRTALQIKYIILHYTANDGDSDEGNANYFHNNVVKASAHYFVDDDSVIQSVPDLRVAWAVGGGKYSDCAQTGGGTMYGKITNTNSLSIEMCDTLKNGVLQATEATMDNAATLCRQLMGKYDVPIGNVYRHFDVNGKHCPSYLMAASKWTAFKARLGQDPAAVLITAVARKLGLGAPAYWTDVLQGTVKPKAEYIQALLGKVCAVQSKTYSYANADAILNLSADGYWQKVLSGKQEASANTMTALFRRIDSVIESS